MNHNQYMIGPCLLDCQTMSLSYQDKTIKLSIKVFELLKLFLISDENIVSREAAIESIWLGNTGVGKRGYTNAVWTLRKSFKDLGIDHENTFTTLSKVGYQLTLSVTPVVLSNSSIATQPPVSTVVTSEPRYYWLMNYKVAVALVSVSVLFAVLWFFGFIATEPKSNSADIKQNATTAAEQRKITNFEGIEEHTAVSNNGQYLAFQWLRENVKGSLYIQDLHKPSTPIRLISMSNHEEASPAWSASDESLAYVRIADDGSCQVRVRHIITNNDVLVDNDCFYQPFKRVIAWSNGHDNELTYAKRLNGTVALFRYNFTSKTVSQVTVPSADEVDFSPHWSSDNKTLVFIREKGTQVFDILLQAEDQSLRTILHDKVSVVDIDWDLQRNEIYINYAENGQFSIKQISLLNGQEKLISKYGMASNISFNSTTGKLYFTNHISKEYIAQLSFEHGRILRKISSSSRDLYGRYVSATGAILFLSNRTDNWSVWLNNKSGSVNLSQDLGNATVPAVSPDGRQFVVNISSKDQEQRNLYLGSLPDGKLEIIDTNGLYAGNLSWSQDGKFVYFYNSHQENSGIYKLNLLTKVIEQVSNSGEHYAIEGSDGDLYVTKSNEQGIWKLNPETKQSKLITAELASYDYAAYFWQNGYLYYLHRSPAEDQIKRINPADMTEAEIFISYPANTIRKFFGISQANDSSFLATLKITNEADIYAVKVFDKSPP